MTIWKTSYAPLWPAYNLPTALPIALQRTYRNYLDRRGSILLC